MAEALNPRWAAAIGRPVDTSFPGIGELLCHASDVLALLDKLDEARDAWIRLSIDFQALTKCPHAGHVSVQGMVLAAVRSIIRERDEARNELEVQHSSWSCLFSRLREVGVHVLPDSTGEVTEIDQIVRAVAGLRDEARSLRDTNEQREIYWRGRVAELEAEAVRLRANQAPDGALYVLLDEARAEAERLRASRSAAREVAMNEEARADKAEARVAELEAEVSKEQSHIQDLASGLSIRAEVVRAERKRVVELEAEVERLQRERTDAQRTAVDEAQAANKAIGRVAELEEAARETVRSWSRSGTAPFLRAMKNLRDLVCDSGSEVREDAALPDPTDIPTWIHDLDKRATADLNGLRDRLARLEARNG